MIAKTNNEWEKEFEELAYPYIHSELLGSEQILNNLRDFIHSLLASERRRLREEIKRRLETYCWDMELDSDQTICIIKNRRVLNNDILKLLE